MFRIASILWLALSAPALAGETTVPVPLQATLLMKVAAYDRANDVRGAPVLLVQRDGDVDSERVAAQMKSALAGAKEPPRVEIVQWTTADDVAVQAQAVGARIAYITTTLSPEEADALGTALENTHVLSVSADPRTVPDGVVLAFDLVSGQTKILVNLPRAKAQGIDFDTSLLAIAKVYQ